MRKRILWHLGMFALVFLVGGHCGSMQKPQVNTLILNRNNNAWGTATGGGTYTSGHAVHIQAIASSGFRFVNWTKDELEISKNASYNYTMPAENVTLVANFEAIPAQTYVLTLDRNNNTWGVATGAGSYASGAVVLIQATANTGYRFVNWTKDGLEISKNESYNYTVPAESVTLVANFLEAASPSYALIYNGVSSAEECPEAVAHVAGLAGLNIKYISDLSKLPEELNHAAVFIIGGTEDDLGPIIRAFTPQVDKAFKEWLHNGGRFWGICGGGFIASRGWWEGNKFVKMLGIIPADSDDFLSHSRPVILPIQWLDSIRPMYFQAGPQFILKSTSEQVKTIARYMDGQIAALIATYGNGKVAVCGPHPEAPRSWSYETPNPGDWVSSIDLAVALLQELLSHNPLHPHLEH